MQRAVFATGIEEKGHFIAGREVMEKGAERIRVTSPLDGSLIGTVTLGKANVVEEAAITGVEAFEKWSETPVKERVQVLYRFKQLLDRDADMIADLIRKENGKTHSEALAEIAKGIEVIEFASSLPQIMKQEILEVSRGVDCYSKRYPLGLVAAITPFNFPAMVPLWMIPIAIGVGNTLIHKPSEQVPLTANLLAEYLREAGLPDGVYNVVHGNRQTVEAILDSHYVKAIGFVGSSAVARQVYERGTRNGKRVLALGGAKNHLIVTSDAEPDSTAANIVASAFGCAGQRCMAASVLILAGDCNHILEKVVAAAQNVQAGVNIGSVISEIAKKRIENYIDRAEAGGAKILLDGRNAAVKGMDNGSYVNPTIIDSVQADHECACDEIFGPVLTVLRVDKLDEALQIENANPYGNAAAIFTTRGETAKYFSDRANAGMVGINIGVPVPREPFAFGGWNQSSYGYGDITGFDGINFWTKTKKITQKWATHAPKNWMG